MTDETNVDFDAVDKAGAALRNFIGDLGLVAYALDRLTPISKVARAAQRKVETVEQAVASAQNRLDKIEQEISGKAAELAKMRAEGQILEERRKLAQETIDRVMRAAAK